MNKAFRTRGITVLSILLILSYSTYTQKRPSACPSPPAKPDTKCYSGSGCLDVAFDGDGLVETFINSKESNGIYDLMVQPDGKIVGVGRTDNSSAGTGLDWLVARYNSDGTLDTSFGDFDPMTLSQRGYTVIAMSASHDWAEGGALQGDGKIIVGGYGGGVPAAVRLNADGSLDTSFDGDGKLFFSTLSGSTIMDVAVQTDGKIVLGADSNFTLIRLNPSNGALDSSFGTNGKITLNPSGGNNVGSRLWSVTLQRIATDAPGEQRIVMSGWGYASKSSAQSFALMRVRPNGVVDTSFGSSGKVLTSFYSQGDQARNVAIDPSNKIVAGGLVVTSSCLNDYDFGVARYTENGNLDVSFSGDGKTSTNVYDAQSSPYAMAVQADGKVLMGGASVHFVNSVSHRDFTVVRYNVNGTQDASFGPGFHGDGVVTTSFADHKDNWLFALAVQPTDGMILAGGLSSQGPMNGRPALARYLP